MLDPLLNLSDDEPMPDIIIACPHCLAPVRVPQVMSTGLGAVTWTDGWTESPGVPVIPRLTRCASCDKAWWLDEAPLLGTSAFGPQGTPPDPTWASAPVVSEPDEAGFLRALDEGLAAHLELELELRMRVWWRGNDAFRISEHPTGHATSPAALANLERLTELLDDGDEQVSLFRCEAFRQLGRFENATESLRYVCCSDYAPARERQQELIAAKSRKLSVLFVPLDPDTLAERYGISGQETETPA